MDGSQHLAVHRRTERMDAFFNQCGGENVSALSDDDLTAGNLYRFCAQIGCQAVFFSVKENGADHTGKVQTCNGDIRGAEHETAAVKKALRPDILPGKGAPAVALDITQRILKRIINSVYPDTAVYEMAHTHNPVSAFHKRDISKRPHNVVVQRGEIAEADISHGRYTVCMKIQRKSLCAEGIMRRIFCKVPCAFVRNELDGAIFAMYGGYDRQCLRGRLTLEIPPGKIVTHDMPLSAHTTWEVRIMKSVWQETALPRFPRLDGDVRTDVLIIGGGIAGILTAYFLHRSGIPYILVEKNRICGENTQNTTAKITVQNGLIYQKILRSGGEDAAKQYYRANNAAFEKYAELCRDIRCDYERKDNFVYSDDLRKLDKEMDALQKIGCRAELCRELPLPIKPAGAVKVPDQAQFNPLKFLAEITEGLHIYENTFVREMIGCTAVTDRGRITADRVVCATHFPFINKHGGYFLKLYQSRS